MHQTERKLAEANDRIKRLVKQLAELQVENKELRTANQKAFEILRRSP